MDEQDLAEAEESRRLVTKETFTALGAATQEPKLDSFVLDLIRDPEDGKGKQLLRRMGWHDGQSVGLRSEETAYPNDGSGRFKDLKGAHKLSSESSAMVAFIRKDNTSGLGFPKVAGSAKFKSSIRALPSTEKLYKTQAELGNLDVTARLRTSQRKSMVVSGMNSTSSDEDDPYIMGPNISYHKTIGGDKMNKNKKKRSKGNSETRGLSNHHMMSTPMTQYSMSSKASESSAQLRKHHGRMPLAGFVLSCSGAAISSSAQHSPQNVPEGWSPDRRTFIKPPDSSEYKSTLDLARQSCYDASSRGSALGETPLPGKSVFDYLAPNARSRLSSLTKKSSLPDPDFESLPTNLAPLATDGGLLDPRVAAAALDRADRGFLPYAKESSKTFRYRLFLSFSASGGGHAPPQPPGIQQQDWIREMQEFAHAATIFKPITSSMAARFTSSSSGSLAIDQEHTLQGGPEREQKSSSAAEEAAKTGMFGPLTRSSAVFYPSRLLCKRFHVPVPQHVTADNDGLSGDVLKTQPSAPPQTSESAEGVLGSGSRFKSTKSQDGAGRNSELLGKTDMEALTREAGLVLPQDTTESLIDPDRNEALEAERPGDAVFRAIFGDSDGDQ